MQRMDQEVIKTIRLLSADAVEKANSGHPGMPMGAASMAYCLWKDFLKGSATDPKWMDRDRFILSAGHGSALHYSLLHLFGYEVSIEDLKQFRQLGSNTPGHPEYDITPGVEVTTGPLGQGIANAVGMAIAERKLAEEFNTLDFNIIDHYTYVICGDGDLMEGVSSEAASLAGHLKLGKLIVLYDDNHITIDGSTDLTFTEDVALRFQSYGWQVMKIGDGNRYTDLHEALRTSKINTAQPTLIMVKNIIGYGSPNKAGKSAVHGSPLGKDELRKTKELLGQDPDSYFEVTEEVQNYMKEIIDRREIERFMWEEKLEEYIVKYPHMAAKWKKWFDYEMSNDLFEDDAIWSALSTTDATRNHGGKVMNWLVERIPNLFGGSADLNSSTKTYLKNKGDFSWNTPKGSNVYFGIREHAMGAILNGIALHGGLRPFGSTFLVFSDYMKPALRLSSIMRLPVVYVFTHDSIAVGEDGPTHQPIEQLLMLRSIPNLMVFRPADGKETAICWIEAMKHVEGPSVLVLSRQDLPSLEMTNKGAHRGGYIVRQESKERPDVVIMATGSEVPLSLTVAHELALRGIDSRVVSLPCIEVFMKQEQAYQDAVLAKDVKKRVTIEMGLTLGWERFAGDEGLKIGIDSFGESGPSDQVLKHFGFTVEQLTQRIKSYLNQ